MLHRLPPGCCNFSIHCWNLDIRSPNTEIRYMHDSHACHGNWGNCVVLLFVPSCCCDWSWCTCMHHNCKTIHCCQKSICILSGNSAHCVYMCYGIENRVFHFYMIILCSSIGWGMLLTRYKLCMKKTILTVCMDCHLYTYKHYICVSHSSMYRHCTDFQGLALIIGLITTATLFGHMHALTYIYLIVSIAITMF